MRLAALAVGLALTGAATAAEAPARVDLVVQGRVGSIDYADRKDWPEDIDPELWGAHRHVYILNVDIGETLGGAPQGPRVRIYTGYQNWFPALDSHAVFWLRQDQEGRWRLICAQQPMSPPLAERGEARTLAPDWRTRADCNPPADVQYEPGG